MIATLLAFGWIPLMVVALQFYYKHYQSAMALIPMVMAWQALAVVVMLINHMWLNAFCAFVLEFVLAALYSRCDQHMIKIQRRKQEIDEAVSHWSAIIDWWNHDA